MSVSVPYTNVNCTLKLVKHKCRTQGTVRDDAKYLSKGKDETRYSTEVVPITAIAVSDGQSDSRAFEVNFSGERYGLFEGAGAVSTRSIELPTAACQFNYNSVSDFILHVRYTSVEGSTGLKTAASSAVSKYMSGALQSRSPIYALFDLKSDYMNDWLCMGTTEAGNTSPAPLKLLGMKSRLPFWTRGTTITVSKSTLIADCAGGSCPVISMITPKVGLFEKTDQWNECAILQNGASVDVDNWTLNIGRSDGKVTLGGLFLVVEYSIKY